MLISASSRLIMQLTRTWASALQRSSREASGIPASRIGMLNSERAPASWSVHPPQYCYGGRAVTESAESPLFLSTASLGRSTKPVRVSKAATALRSVAALQNLADGRAVQAKDQHHDRN